jgi:hypothetical protein
MAVSRALFSTTGLFVVVTLVVAVGMVPRACAQGILACANGQQNGNLTYLNTHTSTWVTFGQAETPCMANSVTGLFSVSSFTYYLHIILRVPSPMQVLAYVLDATAGNSEMASIDVTALLPTTTTETPVTATFASPVALDPQHTYLLAFCAIQLATNDEFRTSINTSAGVSAMHLCTSQCTTSSGDWESIYEYAIQTSVVGTCPSPSPSPSPPMSGSPSPSPSIPGTPSPSASFTPDTRGSADRNDGLAARAVRFVLRLGTEFFH